MPPRARILPEDRSFFELVAQTAFCNPFTDQRAELDRQIVGHPVDPLTEEHPTQLRQSVTARVGKLVTNGVADLHLYEGRDRELIRTVFLFEIYHQCCLQFDALIGEQLKLGETSVPVPFADDALEQLRQRGFTNAEAVRYFSI